MYTGRGDHHQQAGEKQPSKTEGRQTEELNEAEGREQRCHKPSCRGEVVETAGEAMETHSE